MFKYVKKLVLFILISSINNLLSMNFHEMTETPPHNQEGVCPITPENDPSYRYKRTDTEERRISVNSFNVSSKTVKAWPSLWVKAHGFDSSFIHNLAHYKRKDRRTLLHFAMYEIAYSKKILEKKISCIRDLILDGQADLYAKDNQGQTPLHSWASSSKRSSEEEVLRILVVLKERILREQQDYFWNSFIEEFNELGFLSESCRDILFNRSYCLNWLKLTDEISGSTPLHLVCSNGLVDFFKFEAFLCLGAPLYFINNYKETILHRLAKACETANSDKEKIINFLSRDRDRLAVNSFINIADKNGQTALHIAVKNGDILLVDFLLSFTEINKDLQDIYGNTSLHYAAQNIGKKGKSGKFILDKLLNAGSNIYIANKLDHFPVDYVKERYSNVIRSLNVN